uniref:AAA+ ATPase domain-containing protein n=1 Tax=viral metagenome TaxID=1070528 RepID=A0A6C0K5G8_9ZZZZ
MPEILFCLNQKTNMFKVLMYVSHLLEESDTLHSRIVYQFLDKKNRSYRSNNVDSFENIVYILNPFSGSQDVSFREHTITVNPILLDESKLYAYIDKDVYETAFRLSLTGSSQEILEEFVKEAFAYAHKFADPDENAKTIFVYQYNEMSEGWDKYSEVSKRSIDTIYLPLEQSRKVLEDVRHFLSAETRKNYETFGIPYHKTYCFYGPPGSGKTSLIHAVCSSIQKHICVYRFGPQTKDQDVALALKWMPKNSVFVLEDIDCIMTNRDNVKGSITFSGLLNMMDGLSMIDCLVTFITTNHFLDLDRAVKRPGRIDYILEFTHMNKEQIYKMLEVFYPAEKEDFDAIYKELKNHKMTVSHMQKFLFSLYPGGGVRARLASFVEEFLKYYIVEESKMYA